MKSPSWSPEGPEHGTVSLDGSRRHLVNTLRVPTSPGSLSDSLTLRRVCALCDTREFVFAFVDKSELPLIVFGSLGGGSVLTEQWPSRLPLALLSGGCLPEFNVKQLQGTGCFQRVKRSLQQLPSPCESGMEMVRIFLVGDLREALNTASRNQGDFSLLPKSYYIEYRLASKSVLSLLPMAFGFSESGTFEHKW